MKTYIVYFFWSSYPRVTYRKVSKSQKLFFLKLHCPKNEWIIRYNSALSIAFEIYWPLIRQAAEFWTRFLIWNLPYPLRKGNQEKYHIKTKSFKKQIWFWLLSYDAFQKKEKKVQPPSKGLNQCLLWGSQVSRLIIMSQLKSNFL